MMTAARFANLRIRPETADDIPAIHNLNRLAFGQPQEAELVDRVRLLSHDIISLVAEDGGLILGHILFSPVAIGDGTATISAAGLGPLAVLPEHQRQGIGKMLVEAGLLQCKEEGFELVFVLGHPEYYPRFGFKRAREGGFYYKSREFDPYFFFLELVEDSALTSSGEIHFLPPFDDA